MSKPINTYDSRVKAGSLLDTVRLLRDDATSRNLLSNLIQINLLAQYRRSIIGYSWLILQPLFGVVMWLILDSANILSPGKADIPYPLYVILMSTFWGYFFGSYNSISRVFNEQGAFILDSCINSDILVIERIALNAINLVLPFLLNLGLLIAFGIEIKLTALLVPVLLLPILLLATGIGLIINVLRIISYDFVKVFDVVFPLVLYITPVVFVENVKNEWMQFMIEWNPLTYLFCSARDMILKGTLYGGTTYYLVCFGSLILFLIAYKFHRFSEKAVYERIIR